MSSVLVVCTGNICRSPMAEGVLRSLLHARGADDVAVSSAGVSGWQDSPPIPQAVQAMAENGIDVSGHTARRLEPAMVRAADLVLAMAEEHAEASVEMVPEASGRTFTLKELVNLLDYLRSERGEQGEPSADHPAPRRGGGLLLGAIAAADELRSSGVVPVPSDLDVADPLGLGVESFRATAWELGALCERMVDDVFGEAAGEPGEPARAEGGRAE